MKHKTFLALIFLFSSVPSFAQQLRLQGALHELFTGPITKQRHARWLDTIERWRIAERKKLKYDGSEYLKPRLSGARHLFIYAQMMAHDRYFYNVATGKYTVDRYLNDLKKRYGGLDAVLIWPTYPNMGVDDRNQFDLVSDMPGGRKAVKQMIADFHQRGVKVFFPIMRWDLGTRPFNGTMANALVNEMKDLGADGLNGDTMNGVTEDFKNACMAFNYPIALQPENDLSDLKMLEWNTMSWGYYWENSDSPHYKYIPGVSLYKWLEPRHQVIVTDRWAIDKTNGLQYAFFNGIGYNTWENVWGVWNQIPKRYAEAIHRISLIYRQFPDNWSSQYWEPHVPMEQNGVFASKFPGAGNVIYSIINRDNADKTGIQMVISLKKNYRYFDLWHGTEITPAIRNNKVQLSFDVEANGFGALMVCKKPSQRILLFLKAMQKRSEIKINSIAADFAPLGQHLFSTGKTIPVISAPPGMVLIPGAKIYDFETTGVMIEGDELPSSVGVQYPWETHPQRAHKKLMDIAAFYIDKFPVTNIQFKEFIQATHYHPGDAHNFLQDWVNGSYPKGWENKPVTWVSIEDSRAYAAWAGKRLPHEWEWQYAAQGTDGRTYPWGNKRDTTLMPLPDNNRVIRTPSEVNAYPKAMSPFGIMDLTGNVWQWTDEYIDSHTRAAVLKGGSYYNAQTSHWYFPHALELPKYAKYLLMSPGMDRSATIGFRCVADK